MPGSKGLRPHELAHKWVKDLETRPDMSIKVGDFCLNIIIQYESEEKPSERSESPALWRLLCFREKEK